MTIFLLFRFLPIILFVAFIVWMKFRKQKPLQSPDPALRYWFWAMMIALALTCASLVVWALEQKQSIEAIEYEKSTHHQAD